MQADIEVTLNMGVGIVVILPGIDVGAAVALLGSREIDAWMLGYIETHNGLGTAKLV